MAQHIYSGQPLGLDLDTETDISTATNLRIRYKSPDGATGYLTATRTGTRVLAALTGAQLVGAGQWEFRAWVTFSGADAPTPGAPVLVRVDPV